MNERKILQQYGTITNLSSDKGLRGVVELELAFYQGHLWIFSPLKSHARSWGKQDVAQGQLSKFFFLHQTQVNAPPCQCDWSQTHAPQDSKPTGDAQMWPRQSCSQRIRTLDLTYPSCKMAKNSLFGKRFIPRFGRLWTSLKTDVHGPGVIWSNWGWYWRFFLDGISKSMRGLNENRNSLLNTYGVEEKHFIFSSAEIIP